MSSFGNVEERFTWERTVLKNFWAPKQIFTIVAQRVQATSGEFQMFTYNPEIQNEAFWRVY